MKVQLNLSVKFFLFFLHSSIIAQTAIPWDDPTNSYWSDEIKEVHIKSKIDGNDQGAYFYSTQSSTPKPLIISLHTWSGDYRQKDTLSVMCVAKDYNYIHPNFRGATNTPDACGSPLVISDIDEAIDYAIAHGNVDLDNIHVIGVSGGGHAALLSYMKSRHNINTFTAFVPITNLVDWYYESLGRGNKYAKDIGLATSGFEDSLDIIQAKMRSPYFMGTPVNQRKNSKLSLYCGIHDGYEGSVPITQSLHFYNKVVNDFDPFAYEALIAPEVIEVLLRQRNYGPNVNDSLVLGRNVIYKKSFRDQVNLTVFEGKHELPKGDVLKLIELNKEKKDN